MARIPLIIVFVELNFPLNILFLAKSGFPTIRHNEIHDLTTSLLAKLCHEIQTEPTLQPISEESFDHATLHKEDGFHLDVPMNNFWGVIDVENHMWM